MQGLSECQVNNSVCAMEFIDYLFKGEGLKNCPRQRSYRVLEKKYYSNPYTYDEITRVLPSTAQESYPPFETVQLAAWTMNAAKSYLAYLEQTALEFKHRQGLLNSSDKKLYLSDPYLSNLKQYIEIVAHLKRTVTLLNNELPTYLEDKNLCRTFENRLHENFGTTETVAPRNPYNQNEQGGTHAVALPGGIIDTPWARTEVIDHDCIKNKVLETTAPIRAQIYTLEHSPPLAAWPHLREASQSFSEQKEVKLDDNTFINLMKDEVGVSAKRFSSTVIKFRNFVHFKRLLPDDYDHELIIELLNVPHFSGADDHPLIDGPRVRCLLRQKVDLSSARRELLKNSIEAMKLGIYLVPAWGLAMHIAIDGVYSTGKLSYIESFSRIDVKNFKANSLQHRSTKKMIS